MLSLDYIAGLLDGEGCIGIYVNSQHTRSHYLRVSVSNTYLPVLQEIRDFFQTGVIKGNGGCWILTWEAKQAALVLKMLKSHLVIKLDQAIVALEFQDLMYLRGSSPITDDLFGDRECYRYRLKDLKALRWSK